MIDPDLVMEFTTVPDAKELFRLIDTHLSGWIVDTAEQCSVDLAKVNLNWAIGCNELRVEPQHVIIVTKMCLADYGQLRSPNRLYHTASDMLTKFGYLVLEQQYYDKCSVCSEVIVSRKFCDKNNLRFTTMCWNCDKSERVLPSKSKEMDVIPEEKE